MIADIGAAAVLGFILGPMFGYLVSNFDFKIGSLVMNSNTSAGILQFVLGVVMLILTIAFFKEIPSKFRRSLQHATSDVSGQGSAEADL